MNDNSEIDDPLTLLDGLPARDKHPHSVSVLTSWVSAAQTRTTMPADRLGWLVASTVVVAVLQRSIGAHGEPNFLLKGGTYLQHLLRWSGRPTSDVDGMVRCDLDAFIAELDKVLREPYGPFTLSRTEAEIIHTPDRLIKPRRFYVLLDIKGKTWRRIKVETASTERHAGAVAVQLPAPSLAFFGVPSPDTLAGIAIEYQIAQKIHACSDAHAPPSQKNDRPRDVVDLILLKRSVEEAGEPALAVIKAACVDVFDARRTDALTLSRPARSWPCRVIQHAHWKIDYATAAAQGNLMMPIEEAVSVVNAWIDEIDGS